MTIAKRLFAMLAVLCPGMFGLLAATPAHAVIAPELRGNSCETVATAYWGTAIQVNAAVQNASLGPSGPFLVQWYLSQDVTGSDDDILLPQSNSSESYSHPEMPLTSVGPTMRVFLRLPASLPDGWVGTDFYVIMKTDADNSVAESNEADNFGQMGIGIDVAPLSLTTAPQSLPDLLGYQLSAPTNAEWGTNIAVNVQVQNAGNADAGPFRVRWFLSSDSSLSIDDVLLSQTNVSTYYAFPGLDAATPSSEFTVLLRLPETSPPNWCGNSYYLIMSTDADAQIAELSETNNKGTAGPGIDRLLIAFTQPTPGPDLLGYYCNVPGAAYWGSAIRVAARVQNAGNADAGPFHVRWYLSQDPRWSEDDIPLTQTNGAASFAQAGLTAVTTGPYMITYLRLPVSVPQGWSNETCYVVMKTDVAGEIPELREDNNDGEIGVGHDSDVIKITSSGMPQPELFGAYCDSPTLGKWGTAIRVLARIHNIGNAGASSFRVRWYLSQDPGGSVDDIPLLLTTGAAYYQHGTLAIATLGPTFAVYLRLPSALPNGWVGTKFYIVMKTDADNQVVEADETNNFGQVGYNADWDYILTSEQTVQLPDLLGMNCYAPDSTCWGNAVMVKARIENSGNAPAGAFHVRWFLSQDATGSIDDLPLSLTNGASYYPHPGIAAESTGPSFAVFVRLPEALPDGWVGTNFHIIMKTDSESQVGEYYENNNFGQIGPGYDRDYLTVLTAPSQQPDLLGYTCDAPGSAFWGSAVKVMSRVCNAGSASTGTFRVRWYLSRDALGSDDDILLAQTNGQTYYLHPLLPERTAGSFVTVFLRMPTTRPEGWGSNTVFIVMKVDADSQVVESVETNNFGQIGTGFDSDYLTLAQPVTMLPDLQGYNCYAPASATWGSTLSVMSRIQNAGAGASAPFRVRWYLSQDAAGSSDDILLTQSGGDGYYTHTGIAAATAAPQFTVMLNLPAVPPAGWAGTTFYVIMKTDADSQVFEYYENNNFGQMGLGLDADVLTITIP